MSVFECLLVLMQSKPAEGRKLPVESSAVDSGQQSSVVDSEW